ncbi:tRNA (adenosine(37)-N6)-dimethylallyltransferase MiaA, partial [bacterium]|nr:tRNA (adenosine(37)-N6)-dimethylallyltransferase MiaA [bacterium]
ARRTCADEEMKLSIITARPSAADEARVPHRLYGVLSAAVRGTAARWRRMALDEIAAVHAAGALPVLVGGTGLYIRALMRGLADVPPIPEAVRYAARADYTAMGGGAFRDRLIALDPDSEKLHAADVTRLTRAWEVLMGTGRPLRHWQTEAADGAPSHLAFHTVVVDPPRDALYRSCDGRFRRMVETGGLEEAAGLAALNLDPDLPAMKALGVPELLAHLQGRLTLDQAVDQARPLASPAHACHTISTLYLAEYHDAIIRQLDTTLRI